MGYAAGFTQVLFTGLLFFIPVVVGVAISQELEKRKAK